ncbi:hypothetical protein V8J88_12370 [Massilia sp. W12]|uniref:hypothetical protein n=1 Tax=Massilia sp. W12 TaxID=3126507 RepID=UPI0030D2D84D
MKRMYGRMEGGHLILPPEALALLPESGEIYLVTDSERGCVTAFAEDFSRIANPALEEALATLNEGLTEEEYLQAVPPDQPIRPT